jgi:hypothetical protein
MSFTTTRKTTVQFRDSPYATVTEWASSTSAKRKYLSSILSCGFIMFIKNPNTNNIYLNPGRITFFGEPENQYDGGIKAEPAKLESIKSENDRDIATQLVGKTIKSVERVKINTAKDCGNGMSEGSWKDDLFITTTDGEQYKF